MSSLNQRIVISHRQIGKSPALSPGKIKKIYAVDL